MSLLEAQADFGFNLLRANPNAATQSLIISPISISIALAMCYVGAKNRTADQISKAMGGGASRDEIIDYFSNTMTQINAKDKAYELDSANRVYVQEKFELLESYKQVLTEKFQGAFENLDFGNSKAAARHINSFIEEATRGKIKDLISPDALNANTRLVLTNAIYFKGTWQYQFEKKKTQQKSFFLAENKEVQVPMMKIKNPFPYYEDDKVQVLGLPYKNEEVYLYVFLPKERFGLKNLLQEISGQDFQHHISEAHKGFERNNRLKIDVEIPRFKIESSLKLVDTLKQLGITDAFDGRADFSGMTKGQDLVISDVIHKAFIETNEDGSEAAAATGVIVPARHTPSKKPKTKFIADHPFIYALASKNGPPLFIGTTNEEGSEAAAATGVIAIARSRPHPRPQMHFKADHPFLYALAQKNGEILFLGTTNEEGSEAAAATGVQVIAESAQWPPQKDPEFHADHPFLYTLATKNGDILFSGTVAKFD